MKYTFLKLHKITNFKFQILLLFFLTIGIFLRFYNLNWGAPFYFHPDERNIASAVTRLLVPNQLNPEFFAYGSLPIYSIYFLGLANNYFQAILANQEFIKSVSFELSIILSRYISALLSIGVSLLTFKVVKILADKKTALFASLLTIFSTGLIQYSRFGTFEMWLTFFSLLLLYTTILYLEKKKIFYFLISTVIFGILISIKISSLILFPVLFFSFTHVLFKTKKHKKMFLKLLYFNGLILTSLFLPIVLFLLLNPFSLLDYSSFISSLKYESSVAIGSLQVFYTQSFQNTVPIFYQFLRVYPFLLNPLLGLFLIPMLIYFPFLAVKKRTYYFLVFLIFFLLFISQATLFVKWTRYLVPTLPFIYIMFSLTLFELAKHFSVISKLLKKTQATIILVSIFFACSFFKTVSLAPDSRIDAMRWASEHINDQSKVISEVYDLGIVPFNSYFQNITLFNFYELEHDSSKKEELDQLIKSSDLVILPSSRILKSRTQKSEGFPASADFYKRLWSESGYELAYKTPCDFFCKMTYLGDPIYLLEETAYVFDRPTVYIYEKLSQ